jgi:hypothetical protein
VRGLRRPDEAQRNLLYVRQLRSNQRMLVRGQVPTNLGEILRSELGENWKRDSG